METTYSLPSVIMWNPFQPSIKCHMRRGQQIWACKANEINFIANVPLIWKRFPGVDCFDKLIVNHTFNLYLCLRRGITKCEGSIGAWLCFFTLSHVNELCREWLLFLASFLCVTCLPPFMSSIYLFLLLRKKKTEFNLCVPVSNS